MNNIKDIYDFLKKAQTYYLGTFNCGNPSIRPFGTIDLYNGKLFIQTGKSKEVYKQMINNNNVCICTMLNNEWIRINCQVEEDDSIDVNTHMLEDYPELKHMYQAGDGNCTCFSLNRGKAIISSFSHPPVEIVID